MRQIHNRKGFILLMAVALIPLIGMVSVVLTANSRQLLTQSRRLAVKTHAQLACESGIAWIKNNPDKNVALSKNHPIILEIDHKDKTITCHLELISQTDNQSVFNVTGQAEDKRFSYEYHCQFISKH